MNSVTDTMSIQHQNFYNLLDTLSQQLSLRSLSMDDIRQTHSDLVVFAYTHFAEEESMMQRVGLPKEYADQHCAAHFEFMHRLVGLLSDADASSDPTNRALDTLLFLNSWLRRHSKEHDNYLFKFVMDVCQRKQSDCIA